MKVEGKGPELSKKNVVIFQHLVCIRVEKIHTELRKKVMEDDTIDEVERERRLEELKTLSAQAKDRRETKMRFVSVGAGITGGAFLAAGVSGGLILKVGSLVSVGALAGIGVGVFLGTVVIGSVLCAAIAYGSYRVYVKLTEDDKKPKE